MNERVVPNVYYNPMARQYTTTFSYNGMQNKGGPFETQEDAWNYLIHASKEVGRPDPEGPPPPWDISHLMLPLQAPESTLDSFKFM